MREINIYCDESCHLKNCFDSDVMGLGAVCCAKEKVKEVRDRIRYIKRKYGINEFSELKWTKLSTSNYHAYEEVVQYFFDAPYLNFRVLLLNKLKVKDSFDKDYNSFYYTMYYELLKNSLIPHAVHNFYLDEKDNRSAEKIDKLKATLNDKAKDFDFANIIIKNFQTVQSKEVAILQVTDILLGAMVYYARNLKAVDAKLKIINLIKNRTRYSLDKSTFPSENKFNIIYFDEDKYHEVV